MKFELEVPENIANDPSSRELIRFWSTDTDQTVSIDLDVWNDPAAWGIALVDIARHIAKGFAARGLDEGEIIKRIKEGFDAEWNHPSS